jgi:DNA repair protein RadA/Sms
MEKQSTITSKAARPLRINEIDSTQEIRMDTTDAELNRVLGGGMVPDLSYFWEESQE